MDEADDIEGPQSLRIGLLLVEVRREEVRAAQVVGDRRRGQPAL